MENTLLEFAQYRSQTDEASKILFTSSVLTNILDSGLQYPEDIKGYVDEISFLPESGIEIAEFLFSLWKPPYLPDRWLTLGAISILKYIRNVNCAPWPDLNVVLPPEAAFCASAIELSIARFDDIVGKLTLEQLNEQMNFSQRSRVCILACIYCLLVANESLPIGAIEFISKWKIQEQDFETGILVIFILKESNFIGLAGKIDAPHRKSLATIMTLIDNCYFIGTEKK